MPDAHRKLKCRLAAFWLVSASGLLVAMVIFHKTRLVEHPEFVSFPKLLVAFGIWTALMTVAFALSKEKLTRFLPVLVITLVLVFPLVLQTASWLLRQLSSGR